MNNFYRGPYASYVQSIHGNGLYFATDKGIIIMNGKDYIGPLADNTAVKNIALNSDGDKFVVSFLDGTSSEIEAASDEYESVIADKNLTTPNAVGGIAKGTKVSQLEGKTYAQLFDDLLFPTVNPTKKTNPSVSGFALASQGPVELGTSVISVSEAGLSKGSWSDGTDYAGNVSSTTYEFKIHGTNGAAYGNISDLSGKSYDTLGDQTYKATVSYNAGPKPKNNKGEECTGASASSVSKSHTVNVTLPWYASTVGVTATTPVTKQALIAWNATAGSMDTGESGFTLEASGTVPQVIKVPNSRTITKIWQYDTGAEKFKEVNTSVFTTSTETININGNDITYTVYTYTGDARGLVKLRIKF